MNTILLYRKRPATFWKSPAVALANLFFAVVLPFGLRTKGYPQGALELALLCITVQATFLTLSLAIAAFRIYPARRVPFWTLTTNQAIYTYAPLLYSIIWAISLVVTFFTSIFPLIS